MRATNAGFFIFHAILAAYCMNGVIEGNQSSYIGVAINGGFAIFRLIKLFEKPSA